MVLPTINNFRQQQHQKRSSKQSCVKRSSYAILLLLFCILVSIVYLFIRSLSLTSSGSSEGNDFSSWSSKKSTDALSFSDVKAGGKKVSESSVGSSQLKKEEALRRRPPGLRTREGSIFGKDKLAQSSLTDESLDIDTASSRDGNVAIKDRRHSRDKTVVDADEKTADKVKARAVVDKPSSPQRVVSSSRGLVDELRSEQTQRKKETREEAEDKSVSSASIARSRKEKDNNRIQSTLRKAPSLSESLPIARTASASASISNSATEFSSREAESARQSWPLLEHLASLLTIGSLDDKKLRIGITPEALAKERDDRKMDENEEDEDENSKVVSDNGNEDGDSSSKGVSRQQTRRDFIKEIFGVSSFISSTSSLNSEQSIGKGKKRRGAASYSTLSAGGGSRSLLNGIKGPVLASSLRSAYDMDSNSKALVDALLAETVPAGVAESRSPCFVQATVPMTVPVAIPSLAPAASVLTKPANEKAGTTSGRVVSSSNTASLSSTSAVTADKIVLEMNAEPNLVSINDQIRLAVSRLAEIDYRLSVAQLLSQMSGADLGSSSSVPTDDAGKSPLPPLLSPLNSPSTFDSRRGGSGAQLAQGSVPRTASAGSSFPSSPQPSPVPLVSLSVENLPPRPFIAHDGRLDVSKGRPVFVVGSGPGLFSLRLASSLRNTSILSLSWPERPAATATEDGMSGFFSASDIHSLLKSEIGAESAGNSWVLDASVDPSSSRARTLTSHTRSFLFADPKIGGLLPSAFLSKSRAQGKKLSSVNCLGGACEDGEDSQSGTSGGEQNAPRSSNGAAGDTAIPQYDLAKDIPPSILRRLARTLNGETHAEEDSTINFDLLVLSDLALLTSTSSGGQIGDSPSDANGVMLPFEFEKLLGELLTLSRVSLIAPGASGSDARGLPSLPFFDYWPSLEALIRASVETVGMVPTIRSVGSSSQRSSNNGDDGLGVLVSVQTPAEALYESTLYEKARTLASSLSNSRSSVSQKDAFIPPAPGPSLGRRAVPGFVLHFCPDARPRARRGAVHPSSAWGEFGRGAPLSFVQDFGLSSSDASSLAAQVASADLPTRHLMPLALSSRQGGGRLQGNRQPWVIVGSKLLLSTDSQPAKHTKQEPAPPDNVEGKASLPSKPALQKDATVQKKSIGKEKPNEIEPKESRQKASTGRKVEPQQKSTKSMPETVSASSSESEEEPRKNLTPKRVVTAKTKSASAVSSPKRVLEDSSSSSSASVEDAVSQEAQEESDPPVLVKTNSAKTNSAGKARLAESSEDDPKPNSLFSRKQSKTTLSDTKAKASIKEDTNQEDDSEDKLLLSSSTNPSTEKSVNDADQAEEEAQEALRAAEEASTRAKKLRAKAAEKALQDSMLNAIEDDSKTSSSETEDVESPSTSGSAQEDPPAFANPESGDASVSDEEMALLSRSRTKSKDEEDDSLLLSKGRLLLEDESLKKKGLPSKSSLFSRKAGDSVSDSKDVETDSGPLLPHLVDTRWANIRPLRAPSSPPSRSPPLDSNVRVIEAKEQSALVARETNSFKAWWKVLRAETMRIAGSSIAPKDETYSIVVQGSSISLLTAKIARVHPLVTILSVLTDSGPTAGVSAFGPGGTVDAHNDLMRLIGARNNIVVSPLAHSKSPVAGAGGGGITPSIARQLSAADDPVRYAAYVGCNSAWVNRLASTALSIISTANPSSSSQEVDSEASRISDLIAKAWEEQLGEMLLIAGSSFVELPPFTRVLGPLLVLAPKERCVSSLSGEVVPCAFSSYNSNGVSSADEIERKNEDGDVGTVADIVETDPESEEWRRRIELAIFRDEAGADENEEEDLASPNAVPVNTPPGSSTSISLFSRTNAAVGKPTVRESSLAAVYEILNTHELSTKRRSRSSGLFQTLVAKVVSLISERYSPKAETSATSSSGGFSRAYEPFRRLILSAALRSGLSEPEARFIATDRESARDSISPTKSSPDLPLVILRVDVKPWAQIGGTNDDNQASQVGVSLHTLLTIGAPSALRARLLRLHLALPITAIARAAINRGLSLEGSAKCKMAGKTSDCDTLAIAPTDLRLVPSAVFPNSASASENESDQPISQACAFELVYTLPGSPRATFHSSLCLVDPLASFTSDGEPSAIDLSADGSGSTIGRSSLDLSDSDSSIIETWAAVASQLTPLDTATGNAQAGRFSFVDHGSGLGELSLAIARAFPEATVLSIDGEGEDEDVSAHLAASLRGGIFNNVIAKGVVGSELFKRLYDSPEFFRYQSYSVDFSEQLLRAAMNGRRSFDSSRAGQAISGLQSEYGTLLALAATTFLKLPSELHLSLAFTTFADSYSSGRWLVPGSIGHAGQVFTRKSQHLMYCSREPGLSAAFLPTAYSSFCPETVGALGASLERGGGGGGKSFDKFISGFSTSVHPRPAFESAEVRLLSSLVRAPQGSEAIRVVAAPIPAQIVLPSDVDAITPRSTPLTRLGLGARRVSSGIDGSAGEFLPRGVSSGIVRVDLVNLVRHVNHHFQSDIDGHSRKYTLRVKANYTAGVLLASRKLQGSVMSTYNALPHGNHPNHGHTVQIPQLPTKPAKLSKSAKRLLENDIEDDAAAVAAAKAIAKDRSAYLEEVSAACELTDLHPSVCLSAEKLGLSSGTVVPGVTSIILTRDTDGALIPYDSVHGITLITGLRLGLLAPLKQRAYHQFVSLPLYQDMAPWNIVFLGPRLDYIDYDTRDRTYDLVVPKAYEVMEVLFNYKRTVEDFKRCNGKAGNPYNFPFVSDCVSSPSFTGPCKESQTPVPCGDGTCRSDYVSCLRALSEKERTDSLKTDLLWAFRAYEDARGAEKTDTRGGSIGKGGSGKNDPGSDLDLSPAKTYLTTLFGDRDRSLGASDSVKKAKKKSSSGDSNEEEVDGFDEGVGEDGQGPLQRRKRSKRLKSIGTGDEGGFLGGRNTLDYGVNGVIKPQ